MNPKGLTYGGRNKINKETLFEKILKKIGIKYKVIKPHTPKQNKRVERSHRKYQDRYYYGQIF